MISRMSGVKDSSETQEETGRIPPLERDDVIYVSPGDIYAYAMLSLHAHANPKTAVTRLCCLKASALAQVKNVPRNPSQLQSLTRSLYNANARYAQNSSNSRR